MRQLGLGLLLAVGCTTQQAPPPLPPAAAKAAPAKARELSGKVLETLDAPGYTYLRIAAPSGELWAAIPTAKVAIGEEVTLANPTPMTNFTSKTLGRTFETILFAAGLAGTPATDPVAAAHAAAPVAPVAAAAPLAPVKVEKAPGADGKTVADIFAGKAALKDKTVVVRAQVVKVTSGVLGKNWLHLRDGTGTEGRDNDLVVTTGDQATVGEVVAVTGPVHLDRDFGAGYLYPVMIEDAKVSR